MSYVTLMTFDKQSNGRRIEVESCSYIHCLNRQLWHIYGRSTTQILWISFCRILGNIGSEFERGPKPNRIEATTPLTLTSRYTVYSRRWHGNHHERN